MLKVKFGHPVFPLWHDGSWSRFAPKLKWKNTLKPKVDFESQSTKLILISPLGTYKYHGDFVEYSANLTCLKPLHCLPLVPRPYNLASEVEPGPHPSGCCHLPNLTVKYKEYPVLGFEPREETLPAAPHFECPPRIHRKELHPSGAGGFSVFIQIFGIFGGFLLRIFIQ